MFQTFSADVLNSLSTLELELLRYINNHKSEIPNMSIQTLAKNTFMSTTTIIRLCHKLDLEGYSHLKYFIKTQFSDENSPKIPYFEHTLEELIEEELGDIKKTAELIDLQSIDEVTEIMRNSNQIHFFAKGLTELVFEYTARHLLSLSKNVAIYRDTHIAYIQSENFSEKDIVFLASLSGETEQVVRVAQIARSKNATVVAFTVNPTSSLAKLGNFNFQLVNDATTTPEVDTKSRCQLMFILNIIIKAFVQHSKKMKTTCENFIV